MAVTAIAPPLFTPPPAPPPDSFSQRRDGAATPTAFTLELLAYAVGGQSSGAGRIGPVLPERGTDEKPEKGEQLTVVTLRAVGEAMRINDATMGIFPGEKHVYNISKTVALTVPLRIELNEKNQSLYCRRYCFYNFTL